MYPVPDSQKKNFNKYRDYNMVEGGTGVKGKRLQEELREAGLTDHSTLRPEPTRHKWV